MKSLLVATVLATSVVLAGCAVSAQGRFAVEDLRCEYLANPLGIDVVKPRLSWTVSAGSREAGQSAYRILVSSSRERLENDQGDLWDSGRVRSAGSTFIEYQGSPLRSGMRCFWKVRAWDGGGSVSPWSNVAFWSMGILAESEWQARWIGLAAPPGQKPGTPLPFPWLRKNLDLKQKPRRAMAYVNVLGYYELYVNGKKVDDQVLSPAVSDYSHRNYYVAHDVTDYLSAGANCLALWLGRGWYVRGHPGVVHDGPLVRVRFELTLPDGTAASVVSDGTWKVRPSPITPLGKGTAFGDYGGERYDARLELDGWNRAGLNDADWSPAAVFDPAPAATSAQMVEPNRVIEDMAPVKVEESPKGAWLIDMGRNYTGWLDLRLPAGVPPGTTVKIEYADDPPANGRYMTFNQRDEYITRPGDGQTMRSRFNYHAFRFAHVTGLERQPALEDVKGHFIRTAYRPSSEFESSDELLNRIYRTVTWTYQCLTLGGYVVDCPTRERLGYGGDAGTSIETGMMNFDAGALYNRWSENWRDAQDPNSGDLPYTAPNYPDQGGGGPMWSGFSVTLPWHIYLQYGDKRALETNYPMIRKWLAFAQSKTVDGILEPYVSIGIRMPQWNYLGDWVMPRRPGAADVSRNPVSARFINNCHYLYTLDLASKIASTLGRSEDSAKYAELAGALRRTLQQRFFDPATNSYATGEQAYLALPLLLKITPPELRAAVMKNLESTILEKNGGHFNTGMHGTYFLLKFLMQEGRNDLIYTMASKRDFPSWGYMLDRGATTIWESWSGGSHIHDTLISIGAWFIQGIGGIRPDENSPGFSHFSIKPAPVGGLTFARARYRSIHGPIASDWRIENGVFHLAVAVPPGTAATVTVPGTNASAVTEGGRRGGRPVTRAAGSDGGNAVFEVKAGHYEFTSQLSR